MAMTQAQIVTVPLLDALLREIKAEFQVLHTKLEARIDRLNIELDAKLARIEARLVKWVFVVMLGKVALSVAANLVLHAPR